MSTAPASTTAEVQVAVIGGGPAGLAAATAAARAGATTVLVDEGAALGGRLRYRIQPVVTDRPPPVAPSALVTSLAAEAAEAGVSIRTGATAWGLFAGNVLAIAGGQATELRAGAVVLATGSTDLPWPFPGGTLPGVFTARAVQILLNRHRVRPGRRFVVVGVGSEAAEVAEDIRLAGGEIVATADPTAGDTIAAEGVDGVRAVTVNGARHTADVVVVAVGRQVDAALAIMAGADVAFASALGGQVPLRDDRLRSTITGLFVADDAASPADVATALTEGRYAGVNAAALLGLVDAATQAAARATYDAAVADHRARAGALIQRGVPGQPDHERGLPPPRDGADLITDPTSSPPPAHVCRCGEVGAAAVVTAIAAGARTVNDVKRQTRAGMGLCQGVFCVRPIAELLHAHARVPLAGIAPMTARPPVRPMALDRLVGPADTD